MSGTADLVWVGLAVAASVVYAVGSLGPRALRRRALAAIASALSHLPAATGLPSLARRLRGSADAGAGSCGGCEGCSPEPERTDGEIRVPLSSVGKRR